ncbi:MAG: NTP transferase domain-containing protein [Caldisericia bacterium]|nr:NTP transferase domain-containing protein [Caldisericia bacterium]
MKGIILAGGIGTRLFPLTKITNKILLPIGRHPMVYYPMANIKKCGIKEVMIVTNRSHIGDFGSVFGSGKGCGVHITYAVQDEAKGIVDALKEAEDFAKNEEMLVFLGDCIFEKPIEYFYENFMNKQKGTGARVLLYKVTDPERFGVATIKGDHITEIEEKPEQPKSSYAVVGAYLYDKTAWDKIAKVTPSARGEYEITALNNLYIEEGTLEYDIVDGKWLDAGTFKTLLEAGNLMMKADSYYEE